jgi:hypothetical protein
MAQHGGLGLEHIADYQGHSRLQYLMGHLHWIMHKWNVVAQEMCWNRIMGGNQVSS